MANLAQLRRISAGEIAGSLLALMFALEASLEGSRKALLALDLTGLVTRTQEQILLSQELAAVLHEAGGERDALSNRPSQSEELGMEQLRSEGLRMEELRMIAERIRLATRLQSAVLERARTKLQVMANMLAGPSTAYGPMLPRLRKELQA